MKKLKGLLLSIILCMGLFFTACGENPPPDTSLKVDFINAETTALAIQEKEDYFFDNIYLDDNLDQNITYNSSMLSIIFTGFVGYTEIGTITNGELNTITFSSRTYNVQEEAEINIGGGVIYKEKVIFVSENKIFANTLILMTELENNNSFKLNNLSHEIPYRTEKTNSYYNLTYKFGSNNIIERLDSSEYNVEINTLEDQLKLYYDNSSSHNWVKIIKTYSDKIQYEFTNLSYDNQNYVNYLAVNLDTTSSEYSVTYDFVFSTVKTISVKLNVNNNIDV